MMATQKAMVTLRVINVSRRVGWALLAMYIGLLASTLAGGMVYSNYRADKSAREEARKSDQELCPLFTLYHESYPTGPPVGATKQAQAFIAEVLRQYTLRDCAHAPK